MNARIDGGLEEERGMGRKLKEGMEVTSPYLNTLDAQRGRRICADNEKKLEKAAKKLSWLAYAL